MTFFVGQTASFSKTILENDVYTFAGLCGDFNCIHVNEEATKNIDLGKELCMELW